MTQVENVSKDQEKKKTGVSRRQFIAGTVGGLVVGAVAGAAVGSLGFPSTAGSQPWLPSKWDYTADVVVVGYGGAGAVSAITAAEKGASVIVLEKAPAGGGNTAVSSGSLSSGSDPVGLAQYLQAEGQGSIDSELATAFAQTWTTVPTWLSNHLPSGFKLLSSSITGAYANLPGASALDHSNAIQAPLTVSGGYTQGCGRDLFQLMDTAVKGLSSINVMTSTPVTDLVQNPMTKEVLGVQATSNGSPIYVKASKAVVMTLGGFEGNRDMLSTYIADNPVPIYPGGNPYNTGDGIPMMIRAGAQLWHMDGVEWAMAGFKPPTLAAAFWLMPAANNYIFVNSAGNRFHNESVSYGHAKFPLEQFQPLDLNPGTEAAWPNNPYYIIFDEACRIAGPVAMLARMPGSPPFVTYNDSHGLYAWSKDNSAEVASGWIQKADTIAALAPLLNIDPKGLQAQVTSYNGFCANKLDTQLGRAATTLAPVQSAPFYGFQCCVDLINTQGGPKRNGKGQVLDTEGNPIPHLYSGGEFGSIWSFLYPGACNLPENVTSGVIAGTNAVTETPWS